MKSEDCSLMWKCGQCDKEFKYESEKRRHEQSHVPQFECKVCSKKFSFQSALRRHEKQHERTGTVHCEECGGKFRDDTLLKRHMQYAHKGTYRCTKCDSTFSSELALRTHSKTHKPESERRFRCSYEGCRKTFNFPHHLKHHELTHTDDKQYFCKECGKGFIQSHHLKIHQKVHDPGCWLPCPVLNCTKKFANEYALKRHEATHKNKTDQGNFSKSHNQAGVSVEEMMQCGTCDNLFTRRLYKKHIKTCTPEDKKEIFETALQNLHITEQDLDNDIEVEFDQEEQKDTKNAQKLIPFEHKDITYLENVPLNEIDKLNNLVSPVTDCKSAVGGCIVTGSQEINDNCLCAQIITVDIINDYYSKDPKNCTIKLPKNDLRCIDKSKNGSNACEECECTSICGLGRNSNKITDEIQMPVFELRADGIIKIGETFDTDIFDSEVVGKVQSIAEKIDFKSVNTCKDVLVKCMVSGNSTMGEECLCAKMIADDQQMIAQEIEEITPCPKNTWLSQRL